MNHDDCISPLSSITGVGFSNIASGSPIQAVSSFSITYDETKQLCQTKWECRGCGLEANPFLNITFGTIHSNTDTHIHIRTHTYSFSHTHSYAHNTQLHTFTLMLTPTISMYVCLQIYVMSCVF